MIPRLLVQDDGTIERTIRELQQLTPRTRAAANTAIRKTVDWANTQASRKVAQTHDLAVRRLTGGRGRRFFKRYPRGKGGAIQEGSVWVGYNPVAAGYVGAIRPWRRGLTPRVRSHRFPGDFVATMPSGHRSIFTRNVFPDVKRRKSLNRRERRPLERNKWGWTSLPIDEQRISLKDTQRIIREVEIAARDRLRGVLAQELNYQLNVRKK